MAQDVSLQKLLGLQRRPRHGLGGRSHARVGDPGQAPRATLPPGLLRLLHWLGVDDDCPIRLSAANDLEVEVTTPERLQDALRHGKLVPNENRLISVKG